MSVWCCYIANSFTRNLNNQLIKWNKSVCNIPVNHVFFGLFVGQTYLLDIYLSTKIWAENNNNPCYETMSYHVGGTAQSLQVNLITWLNIQIIEPIKLKPEHQGLFWFLIFDGSNLFQILFSCDFNKCFQIIVKNKILVLQHLEN